MDARAPRDGKTLEELGHYDPMVKDENARAVLKGERIDYWLGVGALPTEKVRVLIKKYGTNGTHLAQQQAALERLKTSKPQAPPPMVVPRPKKAEPPAASEEAAVEEHAAEGTPADTAPVEASEPAATDDAGATGGQ
jgi:small subunit ribosomal protein S16